MRCIRDRVTNESGLLGPILAGLVAATTVQAITSFTLTKILSVEAQNLIAELRAKVHRHVLRLPVRTFEETNSGELVSRIMTRLLYSSPRPRHSGALRLPSSA